MMTKEELIEAACEIVGVNMNELSADQIRRFTTLAEHLTDLSFNEQRSFANLCMIRAVIDAALTADRAADNFVMLRLTKEQCAFLLKLVDQEIREHG